MEATYKPSSVSPLKQILSKESESFLHYFLVVTYPRISLLASEGPNGTSPDAPIDLHCLPS